MSLLSKLVNQKTLAKTVKNFPKCEHLREQPFHWFFSRRKKGKPEAPNYVTRLAMPNDYENVVDFLCDTYYKEEPSVVNIGLAEVPPSSALLNMTLEQIKDGMTLITVNPQNVIVGAAVNVGSCPWDSKKTVQYARCFEEEGPSRDLIEFFAYVSRAPNVWNRYCVLKVFECSILAVDPEYRGIGVARKLVEESWYLARDCNYRLFRIDCTSRYIAKVAEGFGWQKVCTIPYRRYIKNGESVFKYIEEPHTAVEVYVDHLRCSEEYTLPYKRRSRNTSTVIGNYHL